MNAHGLFRVVQFSGNKLRFLFYKQEALLQEIALNCDHQYVAGAFFKQPVPTEIETEYAINYIEDALMSRKELINSGEQLFVDGSVIEAVFAKNGIPEGVVSAQQVEDLFTRYACRVMGAFTTPENFNLTTEGFAALLILREVVHHLSFENIQLYRAGVKKNV